MNGANVEELRRAYEEAIRGSAIPTCFAVQEGIFMVGKDGTVTVQEFDDDGNTYELLPHEQQRRIEHLKERLGL